MLAHLSIEQPTNLNVFLVGNICHNQTTLNKISAINNEQQYVSVWPFTPGPERMNRCYCVLNMTLKQ